MTETQPEYAVAMKRIALLLVTLVALSSLAGCSGTAPLPPPNVTVTTTVYTPSPEPPPTTPAFVCEVPTLYIRQGIPRPKYVAVPDESQAVAVNIGNVNDSGYDWWVLAVNVASLDYVDNNDGWPIAAWLIDPGTIASMATWYGGHPSMRDDFSFGFDWSNTPLSDAAVALATEAEAKAADCLGISLPYYPS